MNTRGNSSYKSGNGQHCNIQKRQKICMWYNLFIPAVNYLSVLVNQHLRR